MALGIHIRTHRRAQSNSSRASSSSSTDDVSTPIATVHNAARAPRVPAPTVAVVGTGREALALSPRSADQFAQSLNMNMALCSSPEVNLTFPQPGVEIKPDPVLRRIASEAVVGFNFHSRRSSAVPSLPSTSTCSTSTEDGPRALPPPPRPRNRRPPPVAISTYGHSFTLAEQTYSPFTAPRTPTQPRASSVPPSAVSSTFWGGAGLKSGTKSLRSSRSYTSQVGSMCSTSDEDELDLDRLQADFDEYEFEEEHSSSVCSQPRQSPAPRALRVQVSVERVAFRDNSPKSRQFGPRWESEDEDEGKGASVTYGWEDGIKTRSSVQVQETPRPPRQKISIGRALGRWLKKHT
ncbi:unnamed protein product [Rhizoctonia solani]|uniref:Uncharacterized protein n=1 Tax=Rhizoctonia solani TaxID=456999 RepID=A0A8H3BRK8_9AGAM|nr:unnamed protein product [Rhizoctonia solani]